MSQSEGRKKVTFKLMQPLYKGHIRLGWPEGMREQSGGDETREDEC